MSDEEILLAAIHANREDDAPRLAYADWLQENGHDAKAELIRLEYRARQRDISIDSVNAYLSSIRSEIATSWLLNVFQAFGIVIWDYTRGCKIEMIRLAFMINPMMGLRHAKELVEQQLPTAFPGPYTAAEARNWLDIHCNDMIRAQMRDEPQIAQLANAGLWKPPARVENPDYASLPEFVEVELSL